MGEKKLKTGKTLAVGVIIICLVLTAASVISSKLKKKAAGSAEKSGIPVVACVVESGEVTERISQAGSIQSRSSVDVYPKVPGKIIREILVETGAVVKKGDTLARLENDAVLAKLDEANAEFEASESGVKTAEANLEVLEKDKARLESLLQEKAVAARQVDHVVAQYKSAAEAKKASLAKMDKAKAAIKQLKISVSDHVVTAPISGTITKRYLDPGAMSSQTVPVFRIADESSVKIVTTITQKDILRTKKDMKALISVDAFPGETFEGKIDMVSGEIKADSRMSEVEINPGNGSGKLKPGMFADIVIELGKRQGALIPSDALLRLPGTGSFYVFVIENDRAVQKNVEIGIQEKDRTEITKGLKTGEKIVVQGHNRLKDGDPVSVSEKGKEAS